MKFKLVMIARDIDQLSDATWKWSAEAAKKVAPRTYKLADFAEGLIRKSGDRLLFSPTGGKTQEYNKQNFPRASKGVTIGISASRTSSRIPDVRCIVSEMRTANITSQCGFHIENGEKRASSFNYAAQNLRLSF